MWTAWNEKIESPQIRDLLHQKHSSLTSAAWFPMLSKGYGADYVCMPAPIHKPDASEDLWCYTKPQEFYGELLESFGHFPLQHFWGPIANIKSTRWIAASAAAAEGRFRPDFFYVYFAPSRLCGLPGYQRRRLDSGLIKQAYPDSFPRKGLGDRLTDLGQGLVTDQESVANSQLFCHGAATSGETISEPQDPRTQKIKRLKFQMFGSGKRGLGNAVLDGSAGTARDQYRVRETGSCFGFIALHRVCVVFVIQGCRDAWFSDCMAFETSPSRGTQWHLPSMSSADEFLYRNIHRSLIRSPEKKMDFYFNGQWSNGSQQLEVRNPFDGSVIDTVPVATESEVTEAITGAAGGFEDLKKVSAHQRSLFLRRAADLLGQRSEDFARIISQEEGKTLKEARGETARAVQTMELSAEEAKRLEGEVLPLDGAGGAAGKLGITLRVPCGIVAAITPFNFPLNLVCHKVGPALAAGNAVLIKPASDTPLTSLMLVEILLEAGCPPRAISCLTGGGSSVGRVLCEDPRIRKISFTGSKEVGESICRRAGLKRVTMELGSNCPLVVLPDADLQKVVDAIALSGYANAGQVCISAQRVIVHREVQEELLQRLVPRIADLHAGNPLDEDSSIGPMVREADAVRVESWIEEAVQGGAELLCGGQRQDALVSPALLTGVQREMKLAREELFGPAVGMMLADDIDSAIRQANDSPYGLSAAVFTQNVDHALRFANQVESGNIHINWGPLWRTDMMPYGGLKESGFGKEGPRYAIQEMTETKAVIFHSDF